MKPFVHLFLDGCSLSLAGCSFVYHEFFASGDGLLGHYGTMTPARAVHCLLTKCTLLIGRSFLLTMKPLTLCDRVLCCLWTNHQMSVRPRKQTPSVPCLPCRKRWLRKRGAEFAMEYMRAEDEQTNSVCIGPVNKAFHVLMYVPRAPDLCAMAEYSMLLYWFSTPEIPYFFCSAECSVVVLDVHVCRPFLDVLSIQSSQIQGACIAEFSINQSTDQEALFRLQISGTFDACPKWQPEACVFA